MKSGQEFMYAVMFGHIRELSARYHSFRLILDGVLPSQDQVHDQSSPEHPRTRSQVQRMAHLLLETQIEPHRYKIVFKLSFVFLIT